MNRALVAVVLVSFGCGYRFVQGPKSLPEGTPAVWAPVFVNRTAEPNLEAVFTQSFKEQLVKNGVQGGPSSEAVARGELLSVGGGPTIIGASTSKLASYRLSASAVVRLYKGDRLLSEAPVSGSEDYLPGADVLQTEANRQAALRRLSDALMRDAYERMANAW